MVAIGRAYIPETRQGGRGAPWGRSRGFSEALSSQAAMAAAYQHVSECIKTSKTSDETARWKHHEQSIRNWEEDSNRPAAAPSPGARPGGPYPPAYNRTNGSLAVAIK